MSMTKPRRCWVQSVALIACIEVSALLSCGDDAADQSPVPGDAAAPDSGAAGRDAGAAGAGGEAPRPGGSGGRASDAAGVGGEGGQGETAGQGGVPADCEDSDAGAEMPQDEPDAGAVEPAACPGTWTDAMEADQPQALRSDVNVTPLFAIPGDATRIARDPLTGGLFLLTHSGNVHELDLGGQTSALVWGADEMQIPAGNAALGMTFTPDGSLYVVTHRTAESSPTISQATIVRALVDPCGERRSFEVFAVSAAYPRSNTFFDHEWSGIASSDDGSQVYVNCGSRTDHGEVQTAGGAFPDTREVALTARILSLPTDGPVPLTIPNDDDELEQRGFIFARGTRNSFDLEFAPNGDLLAPDNGPDGDYHEELNWLQQGRHYGFPWRLGNEQNRMASSPYDPASDPRLQAAYSATRQEYWHDDPTFPEPDGLTFTDPIRNRGPDADQYRNPETGAVSDASADDVPFATFSDHGSPLGLTFDRGRGELCDAFTGKAFMLRFGIGIDPMQSDFEAGRDLLFLDLEKSGGAYDLSVRRLVVGFAAPIDAVLAGDRLYVVDRSPFGDADGTLYAVTLPTGR
jgi:glucose/arabinose dehydrogenase